MSSSCKRPVVEAAGHVQARSVVGTGCTPWLASLEMVPVSDTPKSITARQPRMKGCCSLHFYLSSAVSKVEPPSL